MSRDPDPVRRGRHALDDMTRRLLVAAGVSEVPDRQPEHGTVLPGGRSGLDTLVTAPPGSKGFGIRHDTLREGWDGRYTNQPWIDEFRQAAKAAGIADEYVLKIAQLPHRCSQCEPESVRLPKSITQITDELTRLRRAHGSLYRVSFKPLSVKPWLAQPLGTRRRFEKDSAERLRLRIVEDKRAAASRLIVLP